MRNAEDLEREVEKKYKRREKKKKTRFRVSGRSVLKLGELLQKKKG
jgi:hypothetical protein